MKIKNLMVLLWMAILGLTISCDVHIMSEMEDDTITEATTGGLPALLSMSINSGMLSSGDTIRFVATFNRKMTLSDTSAPSINFKVGAKRAIATYDSGSGSKEIVFTYQVTDSDSGLVTLIADHGTNWQDSLADSQGNVFTEPLQQVSEWPMVVNRQLTLSAGGGHSLAIRNGSLYSWGRNRSNALGLGDTTNRNRPTKVGQSNNWVMVSASSITGGGYSLAINNGGELYSWGSSAGYFGFAGNSVSQPTKVGEQNNWAQVVTGQFVLALTNQGQLYGWNFDSAGEQKKIGSKNHWVAIAGGQHEMLALTNRGDLYRIELPKEGQVDGNQLIWHQNRQHWLSMAVGYSHSLALSDQGEVWFWGKMTNDDRTEYPTKLTDDQNWLTVAAGQYSSVLVNNQGKIFKFGGSTLEEEYQDTGFDLTVLTSDHSLALKNNDLYAWGDSFWGRLGLGVNESGDWIGSHSPAKVEFEE